LARSSHGLPIARSSARDHRRAAATDAHALRQRPRIENHTQKKHNRAVDTPEFAQALVDRGYTRLVVQKGAGIYAPTRLVDGPSSGPWAGRLSVE